MRSTKDHLGKQLGYVGIISVAFVALNGLNHAEEAS